MTVNGEIRDHVWRWIAGALAGLFLTFAGAMLDRLIVGSEIAETRVRIEKIEGRVNMLEHDRDRREAETLRSLLHIESQLDRIEQCIEATK
jgi:hypothetical protein